MPLDRPSLSGPPPLTIARLLETCREWAAGLGWELETEVAQADRSAAVVVGPGVEPPPDPGSVVRVERSQGVDGFRWAIRSAAFTARWPPETVTYGLIDDQQIDVRRPRTDRRGVVVLVHGGFWMQAWRRDLMDGAAIDLAQRGWETHNVEYGRVGGTGGWPQTGEDVVAALHQVMRTAETDTVTIVGHSAGAQLALWAAGQLPALVGRVISLAGLCDLETAERERLGGGAVGRLLGEQPLAEASPIARLPLGVPVTLFHCESDTVVPVEQSRRYAEAATAADDDADLIVLPGGDHMSLIEPEAAWPAVADHLADVSRST